MGCIHNKTFEMTEKDNYSYKLDFMIIKNEYFYYCLIPTRAKNNLL